MKRLLVALLGFFFVATVQAETTSATASGNYWYSSNCSSAQNLTFAGAHQCQANYWVSANQYIFVGLVTATEPATGSPVSVGVQYKVSSGGSVSTYNFNLYRGPVLYSCPSGQNWTLSGMTCTRPDCVGGQTRNPSTGICEAPCATGQTRINGVCTCDSGAQTGTDGTCCPVAGSGGGAPMQWCYVDSSTATSCDSAGTNGCKVRCNNVSFQQGTGNTVQIYPKQALGQNCSYTGTRGTGLGGGPLNNEELNEVSKATTDPAKAKTPEGCLAAGMGYVQTASGTTCVGGGDTGVKQTATEKKTNTDNGQTTTNEKTSETTQGPNGQTTTKETTTTTNPDGSTTTTTRTTTRNADGTVTTETNQTSKNASGTTTGTANSSNNQTQSGFCKENPDSAICKGQTDECKDHPERIGCMNAGDATEQPDLATQEKGLSSISSIAVASNASCPADLPLPKGMSFSFQPFCDYASAFRPIIIALAWITAGFLVFGYRGNNG